MAGSGLPFKYGAYSPHRDSLAGNDGANYGKPRRVAKPEVARNPTERLGFLLGFAPKLLTTPARITSSRMYSQHSGNQADLIVVSSPMCRFFRVSRHTAKLESVRTLRETNAIRC